MDQPSLLNADQQRYCAVLAALPAGQRCPCGWYRVEDCVYLRAHGVCRRPQPQEHGEETDEHPADV